LILLILRYNKSNHPIPFVRGLMGSKLSSSGSSGPGMGEEGFEKEEDDEEEKEDEVLKILGQFN
jgi:hypothetical protein